MTGRARGPIFRPVEPLSAMPARFSAGSTVCVEFSHPDYPASDGWELVLYLGGPARTHADGVADGGGWIVTLAASATASLVPGTYSWAARASLDEVTVDIASGIVVVTPDLASGTADLRSWEERALEVVEAMLIGALPESAQTFQIDGRMIGEFSRAELMNVRNDLAAAVAHQRCPAHVARPIHLVFRRH